MKLLRIGAKGAEKPAILAEDGSIRDLSGIVDDIGGATLGADGLAKIAAADISSLPQLDAGDRIGPCVANVGKFICIGLNYADHAAETGAPIPAEPILFMKATSAIIGPNDDVLRGQRSLRAPFPDRTWRSVGQGEVCRHLRPHRPLDGHARRSR